MKSKVHALVVTAIVFVMFLAWQIASMLKEPPKKIINIYQLEISSASYGLNCKEPDAKSNSQEAFVTEEKKPVLDNRLEVVSKLCNGKPSCSLEVKTETLGNPIPECKNKELEVEYRCFKVDRPWKIVAKSGKTLAINCEKR